jgi:hypothetical protein
MNYDNREVFGQWVVASGKLEKLSADLRKQSQDAQTAIRATREQEEAQFKQAMVVMFREQQQRMEAELRPKVARAWQIAVGASALLVLLFAGWMLLLKQANDRLKTSQARADAVEISADVREALRPVDITSCGGRPCIRIDKSTPTWKSGGDKYVLVDGEPGKDTGN